MTAPISFGIYAVDHASRTLTGVGRNVDSHASKWRGLGTVIRAGARVAATGLLALSTAGVAFANQAAQDEQAANRLALQLHNSAGATDRQVASIEDWISAQGTALGITDDELRPALARAVTSTEDLAEARELVSLATDVAAGKEKSLISVTEALSKAEDGNVAGLARLGVRTKDAAGETLSFEQIQRKLADTFEGQSAKAAESASGQYQRLRVMLSETGEAIGYKLLPHAVGLADWINDDGIPAAQDLAHWIGDELGPTFHDMAGWVRENRDELQDFATGAGETAVEVLRELGDVAGPVVGFLSDLPAPIKSIGAEAAIAAVFLPRMAAGLAAASTNARGFATNIFAAEGRSKTFSRSLVNLAGVGGIVALTEGAQSGSNAVSVLGSSLTGAFIGGSIGSVIPGVGTAIGGVAGAAVGAGVGFFRMKRGSDAAADSAADAQPTFEDYAGTLNRVTGATTKATREMIKQRIVESDVIGIADGLGLSMSTLINATLGQGDAVRRVSNAWLKHGNIAQGVEGIRLADWLREQGVQITDAKRKLDDHNATLRNTDRDARRAARALEEVGKGPPSTDKWLALYRGDLMTAENLTDAQTRRMRQLLSGEPGKARANMGPFGNDLIGQLTGVQGRARTAGFGIGGAIKSGFNAALTGLAQQAANAVTSAVAAAQAAVNGGGRGGRGGKGGGSTSERSIFERGGGNGNRVDLSGDAARLMASLVSGIRKHEQPLERVVDRIKARLDTVKKEWKQVRDERDAFAEGMLSWQTSIFGADYGEEGVTLDAMKALASSQRSQAEQVQADVAAVMGKGLSTALIHQLQGQGAAGAAQLHVLAGATEQDIAWFNEQNRGTQDALRGAGMDMANAVHAADLQRTEDAKANTEELKRAVDELSKLGGKVEFKIKGDDLVAVLKKVEKDQGK